MAVTRNIEKGLKMGFIAYEDKAVIAIANIYPSQDRVKGDVMITVSQHDGGREWSYDFELPLGAPYPRMWQIDQMARKAIRYWRIDTRRVERELAKQARARKGR